MSWTFVAIQGELDGEFVVVQDGGSYRPWSVIVDIFQQ